MRSDDKRECTVLMTLALRDRLLWEGPQRGLGSVRCAHARLSPEFDRLTRRLPRYRLREGVPLTLTLTLSEAHGIRQAMEAWDLPVRETLDADTVAWLSADLGVEIQ